ncbi:GNAT family N-acetyltransferase [Thetidibacter halocola]|uniref:GNAT family N-acetyltransferase n=1 Tax=Thetidibacter halocola TaxID=2827239 RepID=A0A8J7WK12_9RHOB|nr:GNAT family N-acetyltransferase [Thetidibacter halocola]MBS0126414.1 GNAT family N-acetyltransferase [Thetidibacter halocola]
MNALLHEFYGEMIPMVARASGPDVPIAAAVQDFWDHVDDFLPPRGCLCIARTPDGRAVGCGSLSEIDPHVGELKRLYVRDAMRGTGLGRALVDRRIDAARAMGLRTLLVDTISINTPMQRLYDSIGFRRIDAFAQSSTLRAFPDLHDTMVFYRMDL